MKKLIVIMLLSQIMIPCLRAQKKELSQARSCLKSGNDLEKAEQILVGTLAKDSSDNHKIKVYKLLYQIAQKQYELGNEKLYLKEPYDTALIFNVTKRMFALAETLDSIDARPDKKGNVKPTYRRRHSSELDDHRANLYNGGLFFIRKSDLKTAFAFFDAYLDCAVQPLFSQYSYSKSDKRMAQAAYWASYCGHRLQLPEMTLKYLDTALGDTIHEKQLLYYAAEAYNANGDLKNYLRLLHEGFERFPDFSYFFPRLIDYYIRKEKLDTALSLADRALAHNPDNQLFLLAKSTILLNLEDYDSCISLSDSLISTNDTIPEAYYNAATALLNKILRIEAENAPNKRELVRRLYTLACPYMEKYRLLKPDDNDKWAPALYRIYLNLNMGKQFEEIDRILNGN